MDTNLTNNSPKTTFKIILACEVCGHRFGRSEPRYSKLGEGIQKCKDCYFNGKVCR